MAKRPPPLLDLYPRITAFPTLLAAYRKASKGKRYRPDVLAFGANIEAELFQLQHECRSFTYEPGAYRQFMVREPGAYQERSPLRVLLSAPHELYSESSVMGFCFVKSQSTRS